ncbi:MAG: amidohydrolase [Saprospiraceae bacterium]|nr:amidohydrolase [Saprospiraceae bacterium]
MNKIIFIGVLLLSQCKVEQKADSIFYNGEIYTADAQDAVYEAVAIKDGLILQTGKNEDVLKRKGNQTQLTNLEGQFVMPGLIEGHGHFLSMGSNLVNLNLLETKSWNEILAKVQEKVSKEKPGTWIEGRGWHQEKWIESPGLTVSGYPYHEKLSQLSPENPVILYHASGHALIANLKAMQLAHISNETTSPKGGRIIKDAQGKLTGIFEENAMDLINIPYQEIKSKIPQEEKNKLLSNQAELATNQCIRFGITSFQDAGSSWEEIQFLKSACNNGLIKNRLYVMLYDQFETILKDIQQLPIALDHKKNFSCHAVKAYLDGALGSYGAWLTEAYEDKIDFHGQNTMPVADLDKLAQHCFAKNLQLCVHGIGDKGNHEILNTFEKYLKNNTKDIRWRIEHAQHLDPLDIKRFKELSVIASIQAIHCTSDAPFVVKRLGVKRAKEGAYAWRSLLNAGALLANGTDCPVESINPFECMYAAVTRKRLDNGYEFFPEQKMTRIEALRSYTIWNAFAAKEEFIKGSLEVNKLADFIILDRNLITCTDIELATTKVRQVFISGKTVYTH